MFDFLTSIVGVVLVLGVMVFVHEWGHFIAAKSFGVRVNVFSFGFGPRLWGWRYGDTDYRISALPVGGYVRMAGDNPSEERAGDPHEFLSKPRWQRFLIALAGPAMNMLLAVVITIGLFMVGMKEPVYVGQPAVVAAVPKDSPAEKAGIRPGDRIVEFSGVRNPKWDDVLFELLLASPGSQLSLQVEREGRRIPLAVNTVAVRGPRDEFTVVGYPAEPVLVDTVASALPAARAGVRPGDEFVSVDSQAIASPYQLSALIQQSAGRPLDCSLRRAGQPVHLVLQPVFGDPGDGLKRWEIGISYRQVTLTRAHALPEAVSRGIVYNVRLTGQMVYIVGELIDGRVSIKQLEGPVGIAKPAGQALRRGTADVLSMMALISLNLAIVNLLPIPILDGGHILMLAIEGTLRRDLSIAVKERFVQLGFVFLLLVFAVVMYNDVVRLLPIH